MRTVLWISAVGGVAAVLRARRPRGPDVPADGAMVVPQRFAGRRRAFAGKPDVRFRKRRAEAEPKAVVGAAERGGRRGTRAPAASGCAGGRHGVRRGRSDGVCAQQRRAPDWRLLHRARRLSGASVRQRART